MTSFLFVVSAAEVMLSPKTRHCRQFCSSWLPFLSFCSQWPYFTLSSFRFFLVVFMTVNADLTLKADSGLV